MTEATQITPAQQAEILAHLGDPEWRLANLYTIMVKGEDGETDLVMPFRPNRAQRRFMSRLWNRNLILKARQLGFTTLIAIVWLDHALFVPNSRCGIIAQDQEAAAVIFRDKVKFAYDNLPAWLRERCPLARDSASELLFAHNNSSVRVATSMRSGTIHRLHVSEFGKICAKYPDKAREVVTGSFQAVPSSGVIVVESTAEGQDGEFYKMVQRALAYQEQGKELTERDYRMHFFPWWEEPAYTIDAHEAVTITEKDRKYCDRMEVETGHVLTPGQRAWYVATRESEFSGDESLMWQEYPGTPQEAFQVSMEGVYYATQLADARKSGRICRVPVIDAPVHTFWDIGRSDSTAIWFMQHVAQEYRFIRYHEASGEKLGYYVKYLQDTGYVFGDHYLPHDAAHKRLSDTNKSTEEMLNDLGMDDTIIVARILDEQVGIQQTRKAFPSFVFDEEGCAQGLRRVAGFKRGWNKTTGSWTSEPENNDCVHGADALRQCGQAIESGQYIGTRRDSKPLKRRGSPMAR